MDHLDSHLLNAASNPKYSIAMKAALSIGKKTLNRYYDKTDHSEVFRIAMGKPHLMNSSSLSNIVLHTQSFILDTSCSTSKMRIGCQSGLTLPRTLFVKSLSVHMPQVMLKLLTQSL